MRMAIGGITHAIDEWMEGPASLIGERWSALRPGQRVAVSINADDSMLMVAAGKRGETQSYPFEGEDRAARALRGALSGRGVLLSVPPGWVIARSAEFPLEAAPHLDGIVAARVSSLSPLPASQTLHGHRIERVDRGARRMEVAIAILPRARVAPVLAVLEQAGVRDVMVAAPVSHGGAIQLDPKRNRTGARRHRLRRTLVGLLALLVTGAALAFAGGTVMGARQEEERAALGARAERSRQAISDATTPEVADTAPKQAALEIKNRAVSVVGALEDLARALPRHSFATEIGFTDGRLRLGGRTMDLPDALTALESSGRFADTRPIGAMTRAEGGIFGDFVLETRPLIRTGGTLE